MPDEPKFSGRKGHSLECLHKEFIKHFEKIVPQYTIAPEITSQFKSLELTLCRLKEILHQFDSGSYAFRYPFRKDTKTPVFQKDDFCEIQKVIEFYNNAIAVLKYTTDVIAEFLPQT